MNNVIVLLYDYYPNQSANTNCMNPILAKLAEKNKITIITSRESKEELAYEVINGYDVYRTYDWYRVNKRNIQHLKNKGNNVFLKFLYKLVSNIIWVYDKIKRTFRPYMDMYWNVNETIKVISDINEKQKVDVIISESFPFISHYIANKLKLKFTDTKWYAFTFDPFTTNKIKINNNYFSRLNIEKKILKNADRIFLFKENYSENIKTDLKILKDKYCIIDYPLIINNINKYADVNKESETITLAFTGRIYEDIRNPEKMFDFLYKSLKTSKLKFEIYFYYRMTGDLEKVLKEYKNKFGDNLQLIENASKEECDEITYSSDIILNIGNTINNQVPSKIFENISTGKPIVNFYNIDDDTSRPYVEKYKLGLNINLEGNINEQDYKTFLTFISENKGTRITFEEATSNLKKSEEVAEDILKNMNIGRI